MNLPDACEKCWPFGGSWIETPNGLRRCSCTRGQALAARDRPKPMRQMTPAISSEFATMCTEIMAAMAFFPPEAGARAAIADELGQLCESEAQAKWLAMRMVRLYVKWPGVIELRRVYCNSHPPLDGQEAIGESEVYPDGIPSDRPPDEPPKQLAAGATISAAESIENTVRDLVELKDMNRHAPPSRAVREIPVLQLTDANRITPEQVEQAAREYREQRAKAEAGISMERPE